MKTLHVETGRHLYGGAQQVLYLLRGLAQRDVACVLVCPPGSAIAAAAEDENVDVVTIPCRGDIDLGFVWRLRQVIAREAPDLVHCHSRRGADFLGGQAAAMANVPAVVSRRVDNPDSALGAGLRYRHFRRVIAISRAIEAELLRSRVAAGRITVIHSAVDVDRFRTPPSREALCREFGLEPENQLLVSAGQFIPRKGQRYLLDALAALRRSHPRLKAVLFGQGVEEDRLRRQAASLGLDAVVSFAGFRDDLDDWLGGFDLLVHTALTEGLGVIALKAQAAGLPVVAFDAGGLPEIVEPGVTGLLVAPEDSQALARAIAALLDDRGARECYAGAARESVARRFSVDAMVDAHLALYDAVLNED